MLLKAGEAAPTAWSAGYFFFLLFSYYLMRPLRDALGIRGDLDKLPWLWTGTTVAMLVAAPVFAFVVSRVPRRRFLPLTYRFFTLNILVFYALLQLLPDHGRRNVGYAFFIWTSVFNLFAVAVFWGFIADVFTNEQGRRLFGPIAVGGTLGAIAGSSVPAFLAKEIGPYNMLLIAAVMLELAVVCVSKLVGLFGLGGTSRARALECAACGTVVTSAADAACPECGSPERRERAASGGEPSWGVMQGLVLIARSPYLQGMCVYMLAYTITSTFLYFEQARIVKETVAEDAQRTELFGRIDLAGNILTLITQLTITGRLMSTLGVGPALVFVPALTLVGFVAVWLAPTFAWPLLTVLVLFQAIRRSMHFAIDRPSREILYTPLGPDEKYKSKSFIDTFLYRGGDLIGAWTPRKSETVPIEFIAVAVSAVWIASAVFLASRHERILRKGGEHSPGGSLPTPTSSPRGA
ncbi:MAG: Npt1/Npt2 family nucleotide transporter [Planctomycetota bacterium]|nr:Npt1/Npt2 family nucleotide transporter [Planctomycetota bacterium]